MKAFISYSLNDQDMYILTLLSSELKSRGFTIAQSTDFYGGMSSKTKVDINKSDLFIGLITIDSDEQDRVMSEWRLASIPNKPTILLIEKGVNVSRNFKSQYILFDRYNPSSAIQDLNYIITQKESSKKDSDAWVWILGGLAVAAIIGLFSSDDKNN